MLAKCFQNCLRVMLIIMVLTILSFGLTTNITRTNSYSALTYQHIYIIPILIAMVLPLLFRHITLKKNIIRYMTLIICSVIGIIMIILFPLEQIHDSKTLIDSAIAIAENDWDGFITNGYDGYFQMFPYQVFYTLIIRCFLCFGNHSILALRVFQLIVLITAIYFLFKTLDLLTDRTNAHLGLGVICILWIVPEIMCLNIYGNALGMSFAVIAIYAFIRYIKQDNICWWWMNLLFVPLCILLKQNFQIVLFAQIITVLFITKPIKTKVVLIGTLVAVYLLVSKINPWLYQMIVQHPLGDGIPTLSFIVMGGMPYPGMVRETASIAGEWNGYTTSLAWASNLDSQLMTEQSLQELIVQIRNMLTHIADTVQFYKEKLIYTWCVKDWSILDTLNGWYMDEPLYSWLNQRDLTNLFMGFSSISYFILFIGLMMGGMIRTNDQFDSVLSFYFLIFIGFFIYHFLSESKATYMVLPLFVVLPLIADGYTKLDILYQKLSIKPLLLLFMIITIASIGYNHTRTTKYWYEDNYDGNYIVYVLQPQNTYTQSFRFDVDLTIDSLMATFSDIHMDQSLIHVDILINGSTTTSYDTTIHNEENILEIHQSLSRNDILTIGLTNLSEHPISLGLTNVSFGSAISNTNDLLYLRYVLFREIKGNQKYGFDYYSYLPTY